MSGLEGVPAEDGMRAGRGARSEEGGWGEVEGHGVARAGERR